MYQIAVEAVEWLMNTLKYTKEEAIYTCKELTIKQHISHVADKKREFVEGQSLYGFSVSEVHFLPSLSSLVSRLSSVSMNDNETELKLINTHLLRTKSNNSFRSR